MRGPDIRPPRRAPAWPPSAAKRPADGGDAHDRVEADAEELEVSVFSERVRVLGAGVNRRLAEGAVRERGGTVPTFVCHSPRAWPETGEVRERWYRFVLTA